MTDHHRPTNRLDLLKLIADMRSMGLPDPHGDPAFQPMLLTAKSLDEPLRWLQGFWAGFEEARTGVLEKLMADTHQRRDEPLSSRAMPRSAVADAIDEAERIIKSPRPIIDMEGWEYA